MVIDVGVGGSGEGNMKGLKRGFWGGNGWGGSMWLVGSAHGLKGEFGREMRGVFLGR